MVASRAFEYKSLNLFNVNLAANQLPSSLSNFQTVQKAFHMQARSSLHIQWRDYVISDIQDTLRDLYRFYQTDSKVYLDSELKRLLMRIDMQFNAQIREITWNTIQNWVNFIRGFTGDLEFKQKPYPLLVMNLLATSSKKKRGKKHSTHKGTAEEPEDLMYYEPSYQQILEVLQEPIHMLEETINSIKQLEKDLVPLIDIKEIPAFNVSLEDEWFADGLDSVKKHLDQGWIEAQHVLTEFRKYQFLLEKSSKEVIRNLFGDPKEKILVEFLDKEAVSNSLKEIIEAKDEVNCLFENEKKTSFFLIKSQQLKEVVETKTNELINTIL